jgi:thymidylate synthase
MIHLFEGSTADEIWRQAADALINSDTTSLQASRLGPMREQLHCALHLRDPRQRWVNSRRPAMNPAFAIAELVWILQGRNDAAFLNYWNPALPNFAGHGDTYHGAYGFRLRQHLGVDQLERAYQILSQNPDSRQVVLQIWDSQVDLPHSDGTTRNADIPCNIVAMPKIRAGKLEWLQVMRSNDLFLGTPHNFVQFTSLQEIMAGWLGVEVGSFVLMTDSLHLYSGDIEKLVFAEPNPPTANNDLLNLKKNEFDRVLALIGETMDQLRSAHLLPKRFVQLINRTDLPAGWHNLLRIVAADSARRRNWQDEMNQASSSNTNPILNAVWQAWRERCEGTT